MSKSVIFYHNPRCSKSREALELLHENGIQPDVVEYLKSPPDVEELRLLVQRLGIAPHDLVRTKEDVYKRLGLNEESSEEDIYQAMTEHPILIERPIVITSKGVAIGRPPANVLSVL